MRSFSSFFRTGAQHLFKRPRKDISVSNDQNLPVLVDFILVDPEKEDEDSFETFSDTTSSKEYLLFGAENRALNIPLTLRSDTPLSVACPSSNFLDLRATFPSLPLPMGTSNGPELCINASFKGYFTTLLVPCIWLVLGSYAFIAIVTYVFHKSTIYGIESKSSANDGSMKTGQKTPACDAFIRAAGLPTPEKVLEHTLKQYGHLSDSDQDDATSQSSQPLPSHKPKHITLDQKSLEHTVRKNVDVMFHGSVPDSWVPKSRELRETHSTSWANSTHTIAMNIIEASTPVVRMPTQTLRLTNIPIQQNVSTPHPAKFGARAGPRILARTAPAHRPAPIITDVHSLAPRQHRCFSSSPLRYGYTIPSPYSSSLQSPVSGSPTIPAWVEKERVRTGLLERQSRY